jgi:hypothetical protein
LDLDDKKTHKVYEAFGRQPSAQNGPVEYEEFDDRLTVKATVEDGRSITLTHHYGGAAESFLARTDSGKRLHWRLPEGEPRHRRFLRVSK